MRENGQHENILRPIYYSKGILEHLVLLDRYQINKGGSLKGLLLAKFRKCFSKMRKHCNCNKLHVFTCACTRAHTHTHSVVFNKKTFGRKHLPPHRWLLHLRKLNSKQWKRIMQLFCLFRNNYSYSHLMWEALQKRIQKNVS